MTIHKTCKKLQKWSYKSSTTTQSPVLHARTDRINYHLRWDKNEPPFSVRHQARERGKSGLLSMTNNTSLDNLPNWRTEERCRQTHLPSTRKALKGPRRRKPRSTEPFTWKSDSGYKASFVMRSLKAENHHKEWF